MIFNKQNVVVTVLSLAIFISTIQITPAITTINLGKPTNYHHHLLIENRKEVSQASESYLMNLQFEQNQLSLCQINQNSGFNNWINLLGRLIIIGSFGSLGFIGNSILVQRYIKLIFQDILPVFLIIFVSFSLLSIASAIAVISFSSPATLSTTSINSQSDCNFK